MLLIYKCSLKPMQYKVTLAPSGHYSSEDNLLDDALANLMLEHSCKNGDCRVWKRVYYQAGIRPNVCVVTAGTVFTCQSKPLSDVTLEAEFFRIG